METRKNIACKGDKGFTLVELAIVMIIIGLLIGGVLKGQELITNAQVVSTVSQLRSIDAAFTTFRDSYNALPGDMATPATRLPSCTASPCNVATTSNGVYSTVPGAAALDPATAANDATRAWSHLAAANLISGVSPSSTAVTAFGGNTALPDTSIGGGLTVGSQAAAAALTNGYAPTGNVRGGLYLSLRATPLVMSDTNIILSGSQAARIDRKLDDGIPGSGAVIGAGVAAAAGSCAASATAYNEQLTGALCGLYVAIQQ